MLIIQKHVADPVQLGKVLSMKSKVGSAAVMWVKVSRINVSAVTYSTQSCDINSSKEITEHLLQNQPKHRPEKKELWCNST